VEIGRRLVLVAPSEPRATLLASGKGPTLVDPERIPLPSFPSRLSCYQLWD
jgi:hypothetical protein